MKNESLNRPLTFLFLSLAAVWIFTSISIFVTFFLQSKKEKKRIEVVISAAGNIDKNFKYRVS